MATLTQSQSSPVRPSVRARYAANLYFQDGILLTGILISLIYLILATSLDAAGYVDNLALLVPVTLGALALGFLMSYSRFDGFFALSHSLFTGLAWILYLMSGMVTAEEITPFVSNGIPEVQAKAYFVLLRWLNWIDAAINDIANNDNYIFIFEICFLIWWLTYLGVWSILRHGYTWRAIVPAGIVLLINTYYAPISILGFLVVFCVLGMMLFVRTNLAEQQLRWRDQRVHYSQDVTFDFLRNGLMYSIVVVALAWLAPGLGRSLEVRSVLAPINERWEDTTERMNRLYQGLNRQTRPAASTFGRTLSLGGARNVGYNPVFQVSAASGRYWRAVVYDTYTGRQWLNTGEEEQNFDAGEQVPVAAWELREPLTQTVTLLAPTGNMIFAAPDILRADVPMSALVRPLPVNTADGEPAVEVAMARARTALEVNDTYVVVSAGTAVTERALTSAGTDYPESVLEQYLQLPDNFSERIAADAAAVTADRETPFAKARAIETYLRSITYNDEIAAPPPDRDPIEYFLYDIREGYCDYYATAMVVMLRSLGIPARVVSGYAEGSYDPELGYYTITERDAHTWVEVYFPNLGWVEFEPTAGETQLNRPSGIEDMGIEPYGEEMSAGGSAPIPQNELLDEFQEPGGPQGPLDESLFDTGASLAGRTWWLWGLVTPILLVVGGWFIWRTRISIPTAFDPELPPVLFARLQRWAQRLGLAIPDHNTPYEQAHLLGRAIPEGRSSIDSITESYVRYRFSRRLESDPAASAAGKTMELADGTLVTSWQGLEPVLWRAWLNKLLGRVSRKRRDPFTLTNG